MSPPRVRFDVIATIPELFDGFRGASVIGRAAAEGRIALEVHDLRNWTEDRHRTIDDRPFGGGAGMVLKPEPLFRAIEDLRRPDASRLVLLSPSGERFHQARASEMARWGRDAVTEEAQFLFICGRYEGVDERVVDHFKPELISIGDYVIAGGEVAAMVVIEAVARLLPGVLGNEESAGEESFSGPFVEYPHFTRPASWRGYDVPEVLVSGNHERIRAWRAEEMARRTRERRPDLEIENTRLSNPNEIKR